MSVRTSLSAFCLGLFALVASVSPLPAQEEMARDAEDTEALIDNALSAAPPAIAEEATVADFDGNVYREGTNDYTCLPDDPELPGNSPMCLDSGWMSWADAWMNRTEPPELDHVAFAYMLQGDFPSSNVDPYAEEETPDNEWMQDAGPHVMMLVPDRSALEGMTSDPDSGGPWVMWRDTPYAHVMIPTPARRQQP